MSKLSKSLLAAAAVLGTVLAPKATGAQVAHTGVSAAADTAAGATEARWGGHAIALLTRVAPLLRGEEETEVYFTQPTLLAHAAVLRGRLTAQGALSLEALTLERGELGAGAYGEGYIDRRHPHTYLHELVVSWQEDVGVLESSLALGRGFAPFGTDDPMMRPFVKFPVNHHLSQVLERLVVIAAARWGRALVEVGTFNGTEPMTPRDWGSLDRFGDSWSARATLFPAQGLELQASRASVASPEMPRGEGLDQRKWSASARYERQHGWGALHALAEWSETTAVSGASDLLSTTGVLAEVAFGRSGWWPALRFERTERSEEVRAFDAFRSPWPHAATHVLGITRWSIASARLERELGWRGLRMAPFGEASFSRVSETAGGVFDPRAFYGDDRIWTLNLGVRLGAGWHPSRMGRYGAALPAGNQAHVH